MGRPKDRKSSIRQVTISIGDKFGRLTVLNRAASNKWGHHRYSCLCACGVSKIIVGASLRNGDAKSCGCLRTENRSKPPGQATLNHLYAVCRIGARSRNLDFALSAAAHKSIVEQPCFYCGRPPTKQNKYVNADGTVNVINFSPQSIERAWVRASGIDRRDNSKGYTPENCVPCCAVCNTAKMALAEEAFVSHCKRVAEHSATLEKQR